MLRPIQAHLYVCKGLFLATLWLVLTCCVGCGEKADHDMDASPTGRQTPENQTDEAKQLVSETWDAYYMQGSKAGHVHTTVSKVERNGQSCLKTDQATLMTVLRSGEKISMNFQLSSVETLDGTLLEFGFDMPLGSSPRQGFGKVYQQQLLCQLIAGQQQRQDKMKWQDDWRGFFGVEQSLQRKPMKPGEQRSFQMLLPPLDQIGQVGSSKLIARDYESVQLLGGQFRLLRIDHTLELSGGEKLKSVLWSNREGEILKSETAGTVQVYRTTKDIATAKGSGPELDLGLGVIVKLDAPLPGGHASKRVVYELTLKDGNPVEFFSQGPVQQVKSTGEQTARVTVVSIRPETSIEPSSKESRPTDDDRQPNSLIQSNDPQIVKLAGSVAQDESDPWRIAVSLEELVHETISAKDYSQAFASATEVLETKQGDCTEHSVLLAALCRARKIPARVATGLVYVHGAGGFAYHMWNEVWVGDRWIPLDATLGQGGIGAAHLKLSHSNLKAGSAYSVFLPVMRVVGQLQIKVIEAK